MSDQTKNCLFCGETILLAAIKCKHCRSILPETNVASVDSETFIRNALASRFELLEEIGRGGMSVVYKALQTNLHRTVALKVLPQHLTNDDDFLSRFRREAQAAASLSHPNLVTIFEEGSEGGLHYIAMEFIEGESLDRTIRREGVLRAEQISEFIIPLAEGLGYAHTNGVIHRDIKSSNILIEKQSRAVLTDFGIAQASKRTQLTHSGTVLGTPEYMSPEQAIGGAADRRGDIYSLGVVLYECLTGTLPFQGETIVGTIYKIINEAARPLRELQSGISPDIEEVVLRALAKKPEDRYQSCEELSVALANARSQTKTVAPPTEEFKVPLEFRTQENPDLSSRPWWRRRSIRVVAAMGLAISGFYYQSNHGRALSNLFSLSQQGPHAEARKIQVMLEKARHYLDHNKLTTPPGANAFELLKNILSLDPGNRRAEAMVEKIATQYVRWGRNQLENGDAERAMAYYEKALTVSDNKAHIRKQMDQIKSLARGKLQKFAGTWTKKMPGVSIQDGITISVSPRLKVEMTGGWIVWDERLDGELISFRARRGVMDQEFIYTIEYSSPNHLKLRILSAQDASVFEGSLTR